MVATTKHTLHPIIPVAGSGAVGSGGKDVKTYVKSQLCTQGITLAIVSIRDMKMARSFELWISFAQYYYR